MHDLSTWDSRWSTEEEISEPPWAVESPLRERIVDQEARILLLPCGSSGDSNQVTEVPQWGLQQPLKTLLGIAGHGVSHFLPSLGGFRELHARGAEKTQTQY